MKTSLLLRLSQLSKPKLERTLREVRLRKESQNTQNKSDQQEKGSLEG